MRQLAPPVDPDPEVERVNASAHTIALFLTGCTVVWIPICLLIYPRESVPLAMALSSASALGFGSLLLLTHRGQGRRAAFLMVILLLVVSTAGVYFAGTIRAPATMTFAVGVLGAGLLLDLRASLVAAVASISALALLGWMEGIGLLWRPPLVSHIAQAWITQSMLIAGVFGLVAIALGRLHRSRDFLRTVAATTPDFLYVHDVTRHRTIFLNDLGPRWLGYTPDEIDRWRGSLIPEWLHPEDGPLVRRHLETLAGDDVAEVEYRMKAADGRWHWMRSRNRVMRRDRNGRVLEVVGIAEDVTDRRAMESRLREAQKLEAAGRLAGGIAHDFNNYLTVILGGAEHLSELLKSDPEAMIQLGEISAAAERSADLTRQLLAFGRRQPMQPRVVDLNQALAQAGRLLRRLLPENIEIEAVLAPDLGLVRVDPTQLEQMILNLALNARDAMPSGGNLTLTTANAQHGAEIAELHPGARGGPYVMLALADTGQGMDEETRRQLFEPFFTTKEKGRGTGLGLATVHGIVQQSGGFIDVESELGRGSTFKVFLPRVEGTQELVAPQPMPATTRLMGSELVLLVEDDELVRRFARHALEAHGYRVLEARDGVEAIELATTAPSRPDIVVTDVMLPRLGGPDLARRLRDEGLETPVLFVSGYPGDALTARGWDVDAPLLTKPFTSRALLQALRSLLEARSHTSR